MNFITKLFDFPVIVNITNKFKNPSIKLTDWENWTELPNNLLPYKWLKISYIGVEWKVEDWTLDIIGSYEFGEEIYSIARTIIKNRIVDLIKVEDRISMYVNDDLIFYN